MERLNLIITEKKNAIIDMKAMNISRIFVPSAIRNLVLYSNIENQKLIVKPHNYIYIEFDSNKEYCANEIYFVTKQVSYVDENENEVAYLELEKSSLDEMKTSYHSIELFDKFTYYNVISLENAKTNNYVGRRDCLYKKITHFDENIFNSKTVYSNSHTIKESGGDIKRRLTKAIQTGEYDAR